MKTAKTTFASLVMLLMLNAAVVVQQPDSTASQDNTSYNSSKYNSTTQSLSRQARVIEPVTTTNWSKIKDLFK